ncbi:FAD binding domain-containing protein [Methylovirgula sp. 4M-Z18]|uniref:FAD binding domain-containing protein n=1 Tax=Methylovirgula sp. 4M-Z18 TaxID=2293567 RepID=UPI000E2F201D|nr:xanthine dehydrogenase family protein subunit M [Methylovirgula sp. 4M-Z18]RFB81190.1 xanthine dehydrogenase family protein subunit M [Methylovirgula sp. 4M-Z18]
MQIASQRSGPNAPYFRPRTLAEALDLLADTKGRVLAGGTDFYPQLGDRPVTFPVIDITGIADLRGVTVSETHIRVGACVTWSEIVASDLPEACRALQLAAREVGARQIQNAGTVAGNLCNASPAADGVPPLLALNAEVEMTAPEGISRIPLSDFIVGYRKTCLPPGALVTAVVIPRDIAGPSSFLKLGARTSLVISIAMVAAIVETDAQNTITQARIAVGACSAVAQRLFAAEAALRGQSFAPGFSRAVLADHLAELTPIDDLRATSTYRQEAALILVRRTLEACLAERHDA